MMKIIFGGELPIDLSWDDLLKALDNIRWPVFVKNFTATQFN